MDKLFDLTGRNLIITGGTRGLGKCMAEGILRAGGAVVLSSRTSHDIEQAVAELSAIGSVYGFACDITEPSQVHNLLNFAEDKLGHADVLLNNAGVSNAAEAERMTLDAWRRSIDTNLTGTFLCSQEFGRRAIDAGRGGKVICVGSIAGIVAFDYFRSVSYSASKAGILGLTRQLAAEWARYGITVNAIAPGTFPTRMNRALTLWHRDELLADIPLRRFGGEDDIAGVAVFLAARASDYMTGQVLVVDGGQSVT